MKSNLQSIEELLEEFKALQVILRDTAEPSINRTLAKLINELQHIITESKDNEVVNPRALKLLGKFLDGLPSIARLIDFLN